MALNPCPECGNMVSSTAKSCPRCGYDLTLPLNNNISIDFIEDSTTSIKQNQIAYTGKLLLIFLAIFFIFVFIVAQCSNDSETSKQNFVNDTSSESAVQKTEEEKEQERKQEYEQKALKNLNQIEKEIASIKKGIDFSSFRGSVQQLQLELVLFASWTKLIDEAKIYEQNKNKAAELKRLVENIQKKEFPLIRKEYAKLSNGIMWEHDVEVKTSSNNSILNITGGLFAANKNIKTFQEKIHEAIKEYRFKQVRYRWYEGADEYTYYDMYSGKDSDLYYLNN